MVTGISAIYIILMGLGLLWFISRLMTYVRNQREVESRWTMAMYDDEFKAYLEKLKEQNPAASNTSSTHDETEKDNDAKPASADTTS